MMCGFIFLWDHWARRQDVGRVAHDRLRCVAAGEGGVGVAEGRRGEVRGDGRDGGCE